MASAERQDYAASNELAVGTVPGEECRAWCDGWSGGPLSCKRRLGAEKARCYIDVGSPSNNQAEWCTAPNITDEKGNCRLAKYREKCEEDADCDSDDDLVCAAKSKTCRYSCKGRSLEWCPPCERGTTGTEGKKIKISSAAPSLTQAQCPNCCNNNNNKNGCCLQWSMEGVMRERPLKGCKKTYNRKCADERCENVGGDWLCTGDGGNVG